MLINTEGVWSFYFNLSLVDFMQHSNSMWVAQPHRSQSWSNKKRVFFKCKKKVASKNSTLNFPWLITDSAKSAGFSCTHANPGGNTSYCPLISEIAKRHNLVSFLFICTYIIYIVISRILSDLYIVWRGLLCSWYTATLVQYCAHE